MKRIKSLLFQLIVIFIVILTIGFRSSFCQVINSLELNFERESVENGEKAIVRGKIYYQMPSRTVINITYPVKQWMILEGRKMIIYYPDEKKAFRMISSQSSFTLPFFQAIVNVVKEDYGLTEMGYKMKNYKVKANTLISHWSPPKKLDKSLGEFILEYNDNKITSLESKDPKGRTFRKAFFKNHIFYGTLYFPMEINIVKYLKKGREYEKIVCKNPQFNSALPEEVVDFKIPGDVKIKEVKW